jgi:hypothetical protein
MTDRNSPSARIDAKLESLTDWRTEMLAVIRRLIFEADPDVVEDAKWVKPSGLVCGRRRSTIGTRRKL